MEFAASIDIGGTVTKIALVSSSGVIISRKELSTQSSQSVKAYFQAIYDQIDQLLQEQGNPELAGIGIGAPGCNERLGTIERTANLLIKEAVPIRDIFARHYEVPAYLIKDSNAAALGEHLFGGAVDMQNFLLLTLGTGLGCGFFINGQLVRGEHGLASELGHITVTPDGRRCGCGRRGCFETYVSATGIKRTVFELLGRELTKSELRHFSFAEMTARHIYEAAGRGDEVAIEAFRRTAEILALKIADLAAAFDPEAVFLSGGLAQAGDLLLAPTAAFLDQQVLYLMKGKIRVLPSQLGANDAALLGAASLALHNQKEKIL